MKLHQTTRNGVTVLAPAGRIDTTTSPALEDTVRGLLDEGTRALLVDFGGVEYISSAGLRVFLVLAKRMRDVGGRVVLCGMGQPVRQVFQLAGFLPLFTIDASREAAIERLTTNP
jgi:anti-sigma B factor antagonist